MRRFTAGAGLIILALLAVGFAMGQISKATVGTWVAALLTLAIFSFLYRDNPVYKLAEHVFIGTAAGYFVALEYWNVFLPNLWKPLTAGLAQLQLSPLPHFPGMILLIPFALGILLFTRFFPKVAWLSRWSMAAMIGSYAGLAIIGALQGDLVAQIRANMLPLYSSEAMRALETGTGSLFFGLLDALRNPLIIIGLLTTLVYFFFSREHKGGLGIAAKIGIWFLMISFGASFGYTVMSRVSLLIGRLHFLLSDWLGIIR
ncbi:MAG: hypothetical protein DRO11_08920 [Methanobacteriota archaeon]|nr:MAG: hypothetical protein DRO11_08920 [Euryarchaeota archaeon]